MPTAARIATSLRLRLLDARDRARGADPLVPPRRMDFVGPSDFAATGEEFLGHFRELARLRPDEDVLDVGCGIGRMARPLTRYLEPTARYAGFDVNAEGIAWCRERYPQNFAFAHADLRNTVYNPAGTQDAATFTFPYEDVSFDFAFATSVFTHLVPQDADRYLGEIARVLRPGGRALLTFYLREGAGVAYEDPERPEDLVYFPREWVDAELAAHGLRRTQLHPGSWSGAAPARSLQDIVIATKETTP